MNQHDPRRLPEPPVLTRADFDEDWEYELYLSTEAGEWVEDEKTPEMLAMWRSIGAAVAARASLAVPLPAADLRVLEARAKAEGVSAEALAARVLHDWLETR
jgi:hypothetical protein